MPLGHPRARKRIQHCREPFHERLAERHHPRRVAFGDPQRGGDLEPDRPFDHIAQCSAAASGFRHRFPAKPIDPDQLLRRLHRDHVRDLDQMIQRVRGVECVPRSCFVDFGRLLAFHTSEVERRPRIARTQWVRRKNRIEEHASRLERTYDIESCGDQVMEP